MVWQFRGRAAEGALSLTAQGAFYCSQPFTDKPPSKLRSRRGRSGDPLGAKNRIHRGYDLVHGPVDVERETNQVHSSKRRISANQGLPRRITAEIDPHDLVIAVAEVAHPA